MIGRILQGLHSRACYARCQAVLSGYLGDAQNAANVLRAVNWARAGTPNAVYLCDPVLGDDGRAYVDDAIVAAMHDLAAHADIVTPNEFELALLSGRQSADRGQALRAMRVLQEKGPNIVILSSFAGLDTQAGTLDLLALDGDAAWALNIPKLDGKFSGAGDLFAALFLDAWLQNRDMPAALAKSCAAVQAVLARTAMLQADELQMIGSQNALAAPAQVFVAARI